VAGRYEICRVNWVVVVGLFGLYAMVLELKAFFGVDFSRFKYESDFVFQVLFLIRK